MLKLNDKALSRFKQNMDNMRVKNPQTEDEQISTRPGRILFKNECNISNLKTGIL